MRSKVLLAQLKNVQPRLYPDVDAPVFEPWGGTLQGNETISMQVPQGATVYYTVDGSDPRLPGGAINPAAQAYAGPFQPPGPTSLVRARSFDGAEWSAQEAAGYAVGVKLVINELMANNGNVIFDETLEAEDWVELRNYGKTAIDLKDWGLSDDPARPGRWRFRNGTVIPAGGYLLVWCDDDGTQGPLHTSFNLDRKGESVVLTGPEATGEVLIDLVHFPKLGLNRSYGRIPDGRGPFQKLPDPSPLAPNMPRGTPWQ